MNHKTREQWLTAAINKLKNPIFQGEIIPLLRVSTGFPGGGSSRKRIGEYWLAKATTDKIPQIFISPTIENPVDVLDTLVHELVHSIVPEAGHRAPFKKIALKVGLEGKMRSASAGTHLRKRLNALAKELGKYPHGAIKLGEGRKKQSTRMIKAECFCGYTVRLTRKWLDEIGAPICPADNEQMKVEGE